MLGGSAIAGLIKAGLIKIVLLKIGLIKIGLIKISICLFDPAPSHLPEIIVGVASAIIWGSIALIALVVLREPIARFLSTVGGRLTKLSFAGVELGLIAAAPDAGLSDDANSFGSMDPQALASSSTSQTLMNALSGSFIPNSFAVIDLGKGEKWLVSRLFIFAIMLRQVRGVRCFVFVDRGRVANEYLGTILTEDIRKTIANVYPWLERVFAKAYKDKLWESGSWVPMSTVAVQEPILNPNSAPRKALSLEWNFAAQVAQEYVALLKKDRNWITANPGDPPSEPTFSNALMGNDVAKLPWVKLGTSEEYGRWIDRDLFLQDFGEVICTDQVSVSAKDDEKIRAVVNSEGPFLAVVRSSGKFVSLIDRERALEELARSRAEEV
jgi:hypothetical protein